MTTSEPNWDTLEAERWIDNDIGMYSVEDKDEETLRHFIGHAINHGCAVTLREIDWDYLVEAFSE